MKKILLTLATTTMLLLTGCGDDTPEQLTQTKSVQDQQYQQTQFPMPQQQPVVNNYHQNSDSGISDLVAGAAIGAVVGNMMSSSNSGSDRTTVNRTVINKTYVNKSPSTTSLSSKNIPDAKTTTSKATYRTSTTTAKVSAPVPEKAKYRTQTKTSSYKSAATKATYRPKSSSSYKKKSSYKSSYRKKR